MDDGSSSKSVGEVLGPIINPFPQEFYLFFLFRLIATFRRWLQVIFRPLFRSPGNFPRRHFEYTNTNAPPSAQSLNSCCRQIEGENERIEEKKKLNYVDCCCIVNLFVKKK